MSLSTAKYKKTMFGSGARVMCVAALAFGLAGCDYVGGLFAPKSPEEQRDEGVALGAGCRQAGQTLEDCYTRNPKSLKAGIYAGWKEMHEYMAAMNIETAKEVETVDPIKEVLDPSSDKGLAKVNDEAAKARAERDAERERRRQARERRESRQRTTGS